MFPKKVRMNGRTVEVDENPGPNTQKLWGECWQRPGGSVKISLWDKGPRSAYATLLHELLHAASFHLDLKLSERQVRGLEKSIKSLCRNNPALVRKMVRKI